MSRVADPKAKIMLLRAAEEVFAERAWRARRSRRSPGGPASPRARSTSTSRARRRRSSSSSSRSSRAASRSSRPRRRTPASPRTRRICSTSPSSATSRSTNSCGKTGHFCGSCRPARATTTTSSSPSAPRSRVTTREWVDHWRREGIFRKDVDPDLAATLIGGAYNELSLRHASWPRSVRRSRSGSASPSRPSSGRSGRPEMVAARRFPEPTGQPRHPWDAAYPRSRPLDPSSARHEEGTRDGRIRADARPLTTTAALPMHTRRAHGRPRRARSGSILGLGLGVGVRGPPRRPREAGASRRRTPSRPSAPPRRSASSTRSPSKTAHPSPTKWVPRVDLTGTLKPWRDADVGFETARPPRARQRRGRRQGRRRGRCSPFLDTSRAAAQVGQAESQVAAAEANLALAQDNLKRTEALAATQVDPRGAGRAGSPAGRAREGAARRRPRLDASREDRRGLSTASARRSPASSRRRRPASARSSNMGVPLVHIEDTSRFRLSATVGEEDVPLVAVGAPVKILYRERVVDGKVVAVVPSLDQATRRAPVEIEVPNGASGAARAGASCARASAAPRRGRRGARSGARTSSRLAGRGREVDAARERPREDREGLLRRRRGRHARRPARPHRGRRRSSSRPAPT